MRSITIAPPIPTYPYTFTYLLSSLQPVDICETEVAGDTRFAELSYQRRPECLPDYLDNNALDFTR